MAGRGYLKSYLAKLNEKRTEEQLQPVELKKPPAPPVSPDDPKIPYESTPKNILNLRGRRVNIIIFKTRVLIRLLKN